jgi:hypothetical protein
MDDAQSEEPRPESGRTGPAASSVVPVVRCDRPPRRHIESTTAGCHAFLKSGHETCIFGLAMRPSIPTLVTADVPDSMYCCAVGFRPIN